LSWRVAAAVAEEVAAPEVAVLEEEEAAEEVAAPGEVAEVEVKVQAEVG
jgi:hypothetical protein